jgi:hypothetical protein
MIRFRLVTDYANVGPLRPADEGYLLLKGVALRVDGHHVMIPAVQAWRHRLRMVQKRLARVPVRVEPLQDRFLE